MPKKQKSLTSFFSPVKRKLDAGAESKAKKAKTDLTDEQKARILKSKRAAMQKRKAKANFTNLESVMEPTWKEKLKAEFEKPYFKELKKHLAAEVKKGTTIYPPAAQVYRAFELCPWDDLKVVILGQDPYHNVGQAEGLCFSVSKKNKKATSKFEEYV